MLERGGRRYLCLAHEQPPANFSVLDVTDPRAPRLLTQTRLSHGAVRSNSLAVGDDLLLVAYQVQTPGTQDGDDAPLPVRHERFDTRFRAHNINLHAQRRHRAYVGYLDAGAIILDVCGRSRAAGCAAVGLVDRSGGGLHILEYSGPG